MQRQRRTRGPAAARSRRAPRGRRRARQLRRPGARGGVQLAVGPAPRRRLDGHALGPRRARRVQPCLDEHGAQASLRAMSTDAGISLASTPAPHGDYTTSATRSPPARIRRRSPRSRSPARGAQRVPPADRRRDLRALEDAREDPERRRDRPHRRGPRRVLLGRRPARARRLAATSTTTRPASRVGRFHVTDLHVQIRRLPKPVVAMVAGYAIGGGHVLHLVCDLTIAADNARFGQVGPKVGSFDGGFGAGLLANLGRARRRPRRSGSCAGSTTRSEALEMGLVNTVVPLERLEAGDGAVVPRDARRSRRSRCGS